MWSDILSIDVYQLSDSSDICVPAECQALLAEMGWLLATVSVYIQCASGGTISSVLISGIRIQ